MSGTLGISNELKLKAKIVAADLSRKIEDALRRQALREAQHIHVAVSEETVTLTGNVHSWQEREAAQGVAWSASGIKSVINELQVA